MTIRRLHCSTTGSNMSVSVFALRSAISQPIHPTVRATRQRPRCWTRTPLVLVPPLTASFNTLVLDATTNTPALMAVLLPRTLSWCAWILVPSSAFSGLNVYMDVRGCSDQKRERGACSPARHRWLAQGSSPGREAWAGKCLTYQAPPGSVHCSVSAIPCHTLTWRRGTQRLAAWAGDSWLAGALRLVA